MKSLYLDNNGDLVINQLNNFKMIDGEDEVRQRNRLTLGTRAGEWFLDSSFGLPWFELMEKGVTNDEIEREIVAALLEDDSVKEITEMEFNLDKSKRKLNIYLEGTLTGGEDFKLEAEV
jgi:hypothetical protein